MGSGLPSMTPVRPPNPPGPRGQPPRTFLGIDARYVMLRAEESGLGEDDLVVHLRLGDPPKVIGGGGIETVDRQGRRPMTVWRGSEALGLQFDGLLLDGYRGRRSVEPDIRAIEIMAGAFVAGDEAPKKLIVQGSAVPHDYLKASGNRWVIAEPPDWTDPVVRIKPLGVRVRQAVNLKLLLWTEPEELKRIKPRWPTPQYKIYKANGRETFIQIAHRQLGNSKLGGELATLNRERNPAFKGAHPTANTKPNKGVLVWLPTKALQAEWERIRRRRPKR